MIFYYSEMYAWFYVYIQICGFVMERLCITPFDSRLMMRSICQDRLELYVLSAWVLIASQLHFPWSGCPLLCPSTRMLMTQPTFTLEKLSSLFIYIFCVINTESIFFSPHTCRTTSYVSMNIATEETALENPNSVSLRMTLHMKDSNVLQSCRLYLGGK